MKNIINQCYFILIALFTIVTVIPSCSSEPDLCEDVVCGNGSCEDGSCLCDDGWIGSGCLQKDLSGEYIMVGYTTIDCPDLYFTDIQGDGSTSMLCGKAEDFDVCYEFSMNLTSSFNYVRKTALFLHNEDGSVETIFDTQESGTWRLEGADGFKTFKDSGTAFRWFASEGNNRWSYTGATPDGGIGCKIKEVFQKL